MAEFKIVDVRDAAGIPVHNIIEVDGQRLCTFFRPNDVAAKITHDVKDMELRDDDVMLCTPPKSGKTFNPFWMNGLARHYHLNESTFILAASSVILKF